MPSSKLYCSTILTLLLLTQLLVVPATVANLSKSIIRLRLKSPQHNALTPELHSDLSQTVPHWYKVLADSNYYNDNQDWVEQDNDVATYTPSSSVGGFSPVPTPSDTTLVVTQLGTSYLLPTLSAQKKKKEEKKHKAEEKAEKAQTNGSANSQTAAGKSKAQTKTQAKTKANL